MTVPNKFWESIEELVRSHPLVIDRPRGSAHPRYPELIYPLDYGYLDGTTTVDGGGIDIWVGSAPSREVVGVVLTVDLDKQDAELKLLSGCTIHDIQTIVDFLNGNSMSAIYIERYK